MHALTPFLFIFLAIVFLFGSNTQLVFNQAQAQKQQDGRQLTLGTVTTLSGKGKRWALVIGVDRYKDDNIGQLAGAANDANSLADALVRYAGFPSEQVIVLASDRTDAEQPTRSNILRYLSNLKGQVPKDGLLLLAFSGHGIERGGKGFLIPSDASFTDDISLLEDTAININRVKERIKETGVKQVMILLDACRNDPVGRSNASNPLTTTYTKAFDFDVRNKEVEAFAIFYATAVGQRAYEYTSKKQGYFTYAFIEGLKGAAANSKGEITLTLLVKYLPDSVPKRVSIDLGAGKPQQPFAVIEGYKADELVFAVNTHNTDTLASKTNTASNSSNIATANTTKSAKSSPKQYGLDFVWVEPGTFLMGSPDSEEDRDENEGPVHRVTISKGFWMGRYEVTKGQWKTLMGTEPFYFSGDDSLPAENVS